MCLPLDSVLAVDFSVTEQEQQQQEEESRILGVRMAEIFVLSNLASLTIILLYPNSLGQF